MQKEGIGSIGATIQRVQPIANKGILEIVSGAIEHMDAAIMGASRKRKLDGLRYQFVEKAMNRYSNLPLSIQCHVASTVPVLFNGVWGQRHQQAKCKVCTTLPSLSKKIGNT